MKITLILCEPTTDFIPLAGLYLIANLEKHGHEVSFVLLEKDRIKSSFEEPADYNYLIEVMDRSEDPIAIGCMNDMLPFFLYAITRCRSRFQKTIVLGGTGPSEFAREILARFSEVDFIVKDRDPEILARLLNSVEEGQAAVNGVVYRENGNVCYTQANQDYFHHFTLPTPAIRFPRKFNKFRLVTVEGCPYHCTFCNVESLIPKTLKYRDLDQVMAEIQWALDHFDKTAPHLFVIVDEAFVVNRERVLEFCSLIKKSGLEINWKCYGRINHMDGEMMARMKAAGCKGLFFGIEAGSDLMLKSVRKGFSISEAMDVLVQAKGYFKRVVASFIWGYPFESFDDFCQTLLQMQCLTERSVTVQLNLLSPVKGSGIMKEFGDKLSFAPAHLRLSELNPLRPESEEFKNFAKQNKDIFLGYHIYDTPHLARKIEVLNRFEWGKGK